MATTAYRNYTSEIKSLVRGLWSGAIDERQFNMRFLITIDTGLRAAWLEGAATCGILEDELTQQEKVEIENFIIQQVFYISGFKNAIIKGSKENDGKLRPLQLRAKMWSNAYNKAKAKAQQFACGDRKMKWIWNPLKDHCRTCVGFNGRVYRMSTWAQYNALPQSNALECRGFLCGCRLEPTDEPMTKGKFPARLLASVPSVV